MSDPWTEPEQRRVAKGTPPVQAGPVSEIPTRDIGVPLKRQQANHLESLSETELAATLRSDQDQRWHAGDRVLVESYLERLPFLHSRRRTVLELIHNEIRLRETFQETPRLEDYLLRFPQHAAEIRQPFDRASAVFEVGRPRAGEGNLTSPAASSLACLSSDSPRILVEPPLPERLGRYRVTSRLGSGGFGVVYLGYDEDLQRDVAIKVPRDARRLSSRELDAYLIEGRNLAGLDHPGIVPIYDVGRTPDGVLYLVSKFIRGVSLADRIKLSRLSVVEAVALVAAVADALNHAHQHGLVHRDIKPPNVLLGHDGRPVVVDFGLALREQDVGTGPICAGTPTYMSPEQARGEGHLVDGRTDIYSLGVVFYELLTGQRPFSGFDRTSLLEQIKTNDPRPPAQLDPRIARELDRICMRALSKRASDRYRTALELADDLLHWLDGVTQDRVGGAAPDTTPANQPLTNSPASDSRENPVVPRGLRSFDSQDADFFLRLLPGPRDRHGLPESLRFWKTRIEDTDAECGFRVGVLYGPSGCGKSSLVKAGLLPRLSPHVRTLYVDTALGDTEGRILGGLRRHFPSLGEADSLAEVLNRLRRDRILPSGDKVLLVLDQFEHWLQTWRGRPDAELVTALRQCDGGRVQALLLVRDDFWMTLTRFLRELEIPLQEGDNSLGVDLFDLRHARKVLACFGRAYAALPENEPGSEQALFLDRAVHELAQGDKVFPVRLSLFAEMVKAKQWLPATLRAHGGTEGIGVVFLDEAFAAPTAPPANRVHERAARDVLRALLPTEGSDIKGQMRSHQSLLAASGYEGTPAKFHELLNILDKDLRLITPTDREDVEPPGQNFYQLAHDFLVPALRQWLNARQRQTRRGRAEICLTERAAFWALKPESHYLPSLWEWSQIALFARRMPWSSSQRGMMIAARHFHLAHGSILACLLILVGLLGLGLKLRLDERQQRLHVDGLIAQLLVAEPGQVEKILQDLESCPDLARPRLQAIAADPGQSLEQQLRARLALLPTDESQIRTLELGLFDSKEAELTILIRSLRVHQNLLLEDLWASAQDVERSAEHLARAGRALAEYAPHDPRWASIAEEVVDYLLRANPLVVKDWVDAFRPVRRHLLPALADAFRRQDQAEHGLASSIVADYAADIPPMLADLILDANVEQYRHLIGTLSGFPSETKETMRQELSKIGPAGASEEAQEAFAKRQANAAITLYRLGELDLVWPLLKATPAPRARTWLIHRLGALATTPTPLMRRWDAETDVTVRRALLLSLGGFPASGERADQEQKTFMSKLVMVHHNDPDPGVHSAVEWLLNQWGMAERLREAGPQPHRPAGASTGWGVDGEGHMMVSVNRPAAAIGRGEAVRAARRFAIATKEVTIEQYRRFRPDYYHEAQPGKEGEYPVNVVSWFDAVAYCRWLSDREGIANDQQCYPPLDEIGGGLTLPPDYLRRTGYRLPTEIEWEQACRAGTVTSRAYGTADKLLPFYAWFDGNSKNRPCPIGRLKPNDLGLFDMLGNTMEWCHGSVGGSSDSVTDGEEVEAIRNDLARVARGGGFDHRGGGVRSTQRDLFPASTKWHSIGFRVARTALPGH